MVFSPSLRRLIISSARILTNPSSEGVREHSERGGGLATSVRAGLSYPRSEAEWDLAVRADPLLAEGASTARFPPSIPTPSVRLGSCARVAGY